jgi:nephrocystin-3
MTHSSLDETRRSIRVFVSSTFRDMQPEREELVKRVFPIIRAMCESRGATFAEIDLRWGVTDEQKAEGAVLPLCLAEIDRSRPYFLGLLGQRYGWVPDEIPADLVQQIGWLPDSAGKSVTELEIIHGVLHDPGAAQHAYFYLRDPAWTDAQPPAVRAGLVDSDPALGPMLRDLRDRVRASGLPVADYTDARSLGERVLGDLSALVEARFPAGQLPTHSERDDAAHAAFAHVHSALAFARPAEQARLDAHGAGDGGPLLLSGEPGSGGDGQAALWAARWRDAHPDTVVIEHHVEAGPHASDPTAMQRRLLLGLRDAATGVASPDDPSSDPLTLREQWFAAVTAWGDARLQAVLVVTGAHLLDDVLGAPDLTWLPSAIPANLRVVVASEGDRPLQGATRLGLTVLPLAEFTEQERTWLSAQYLARFSKALDTQHLQRIANAPNTGNELYLRTVLDELRQHGDHFTISTVLDHYLGAATTDDLLELVFARYERDFEGERPGLIGDAFRALYAARRGISESELLELLSGDAVAGPLPRAVWTPAFLACEAALVDRGGMLSLASEIHRTAVRDRYLPSAEAETAAHAVLARYFAAAAPGIRRFDELPWQQLGAGDIAGLSATLGDLDTLPGAYRHDAAALRRLWARAEERGASIVGTYAAVLSAPGAHPEVTWEVARLVTDAGYPREALALNRALAASNRSGPPPALPGCASEPGRGAVDARRSARRRRGAVAGHRRDRFRRRRGDAGRGDREPGPGAARSRGFR